MRGLKYDEGKPDLTLVPRELKTAVAEVMAHGAKKYGRDNWKLVEDGKRRYLAALMRHIDAFADGEETDKDSGYSHLAHAATNIAFLLHLFKKE